MALSATLREIGPPAPRPSVTPKTVSARGPEPQAGSIRLALTSRAPALFRLHAVRDGVRVLVLAVLDVAAIWMAAMAVAALARWLGSRDSAGPSRWLEVVVGSLPLAQLALPIGLALAFSGCYGPNDERRESGAIGRAVAMGLGLALWSFLWTAPITGWAIGFAILWLAIAPALVVERKMVDVLVRAARPGVRGATFAAVVGPADEAATVIDHPALGENPWCHLTAFFDPERHPIEELPGALGALLRERKIDTVILSGNLDQQRFGVILDVAATSGCQVFSLPRVVLGSTVYPRLRWRNGYSVVEMTRPGLVGAKLVIKRAIDILGSVVGLVVMAPVMLFVAMAVRATSTGPVFFRQTRIGRGGRRFTILKFRTMTVDAEQRRSDLEERSVYDDPRLFKVIADPRVTRVGAFLRRTSLDEVPQLLNVLRGEMSLVGPRPPLPSEVALYAGHHYARFDVKPGLTGPWQVSGRNSIREFEKVIRLETAYIRRWSLTLDLELLIRTIPVVLSRRGAH